MKASHEPGCGASWFDRLTMKRLLRSRPVFDRLTMKRFLLSRSFIERSGRAFRFRGCPAAGPPSMLALKDVDSGYRRFQALFRVAMTVNAGEAVAVIGANGAGKTTLLRVISGLLPASAGAI